LFLDGFHCIEQKKKKKVANFYLKFYFAPKSFYHAILENANIPWWKNLFKQITLNRNENKVEKYVCIQNMC